MIHLLAEHWDLVVKIVVYVGVVVGLYYTLTGQIKSTRMEVASLKVDANTHWDSMEKKFDIMVKDFNSHRASETPHINCPVHSRAILDITDRLDRIQGDLSGVREDLGELNRTLLIIATQGKAKVV